KLVTGVQTCALPISATGDIVLSGDSEDAGLTTVSGTIRVPTGRFDRARIESVTGAVDFAGTIARGGSLDVDTHSGAIDLRLPRKIGRASCRESVEIQ